MFDRDFKGIWIPKEIWLNEELSITEKALFAEIDSLDTNSHCTASNEYFAKFLGVTERTISNAITHLKDLGLISSEFDGRVRTLRVEKFSMQSRKNFDILNHNISNANSNNNQQELFTDNINKSNKEDTYREKVQNFIDKFNEICVSLPRCVRLTPKRSKAIVSILKKFTDEEILEVFEKLEASDFCSGRSGKWRANIDFILSENNFVKTLEGKYDNRPRCNVETISSGNKRQLTPEEKERIRKNGTKF